MRESSSEVYGTIVITVNEHACDMRYKKDVYYIFGLLALSFFAWVPLLGMILRGNGYMYMLENVQKWFWGRQYPLTGFSAAAAISGAMFRKFYGVNMSLYLWTEVIVMLGIGLLMYWFVRILTKKRIVAFAASLIYTVNYFGHFDIQVNTCYCYFMERVLNVPFIILSLIYLHLFLEKVRRKFLFTSFILFFVGLGLGHFSFLLTPIFFVYPFLWFLVGKRGFGNIVKGSVVSLVFILITVLILMLQQIHEAGFAPKWTMIEFLLHPAQFDYPANMARQLAYWSQYPILLRTFFDTPDFHQNVLSVSNANAIAPGVIVVYLIALFISLRTLPKHRAIIISVIVATGVIFFLNAWFGQYGIAHQAGTNRYLYFPTLLLSIFWAYVLWAVFWKSPSWKTLFGVGILVCYYILNVTLIWDNFKAVEQWNRPTLVIYEYIINKRAEWQPQTLVLGEYPAIKVQEAQFLTELIGGGDVTIMSASLDMDDWRPIASNSSHILSLTYDPLCECVREEEKAHVAK